MNEVNIDEHCKIILHLGRFLVTLISHENVCSLIIYKAFWACLNIKAESRTGMGRNYDLPKTSNCCFQLSIEGLSCCRLAA